jgi:chemotaxis protein CheC
MWLQANKKGEKMKLEKLNQINKQAALSASAALSKLIGQDVSISMATVEVKKVEEVKPLIGAEEIVAGIYLPVTGAVKGATLLVFPKDSTFILCDLMMKRPVGTTRKLTELDESALKEVGNILSGNYFTALGNKLQIKIIEHIPNFSFDMFGAMATQVTNQFALKTDEALVLQVHFKFRSKEITGYMLLLFELEQIEAIVSALEKV